MILIMVTLKIKKMIPNYKFFIKFTKRTKKYIFTNCNETGLVTEFPKLYLS